ncbi:MAG: HemY protein [Paracoccaceae bacterium]|jgi:HemY protein
MIWSVVKITLFVALIAALTFVASFLIDAGGEVRIAVGSMEFSLTPLAGMISLVLVLLGGWITFRVAGLLVAIFRFFNGDETAISRYFDRNRERRGFEALADGLMALASGEGRVAMAKATKAEKYLGRPDLTLLLSAQAAEMTGETGKAQGFYKKLLADDRTRFVGVQGIMKQKLAEGDTDTALKLAEKAFVLRPRHEGTLDTLFSLQSDKRDWKGARETLTATVKARALPKALHTRRDAVLALAEAREKIEAGEVENGKVAALQANRLSPDLIPAAVLAAEMHVLNSSSRAAIKILKKAWSAQPHPDLAAAFANIAPDETAKERQARFQPLLKLRPEDTETKLLAAELAIVTEDFPAARKALGDVAENEPTTRSLTVMAAIERGEGAPDNVVRGWLTKALGAPRGPQWICKSCHNIHGNWVPVCENCSGFDTLDWQDPPQSSEPSQRSSDMLPLIVGTLDDVPELPVPEVENTAVIEVKTTPDTSDDLDGIVGDIHTVPEIPGR